MNNSNKLFLQNYSQYLLPACVLLCLMGVITGAAVFSLTFSDADVSSYVDSQRFLPLDFSSGMIIALRTEVITLSVVLVCACFALGWMVIPVVLVYRGLGIGIGACCLTESFGLHGALFSLAVLLVPYMISMTVITIACRDALKISFGLFLSMLGKHSAQHSVFPLIIKIPICAAVIVCSAALTALLRITLHTIIS